MESVLLDLEDNVIEGNQNWQDWIFDIFDDIDLITFLYSNWFVDIDHTYHFEHWLEHQFY
jgi:methionine synthase II (cobalamin-independent)